MAAAAQTLSPTTPEKAPAVPPAQAEEVRWRPVLTLPCQLTADLPLPHFKVSDFLAVRVGSVIGTNWRLAHDIPLRINGTLIAWAELEGSGSKLAVRLTELA